MQTIRMGVLVLDYPEPDYKVSGLISGFLENIVHPWIMARYGQMTYLFEQLFYRRCHRYFCLLQGWLQGQSSRLYSLSSLRNESWHRGGIYRGLLYIGPSVLHAVYLYCGHGKHAVEPFFVVFRYISATKEDGLLAIGDYAPALFRGGFLGNALRFHFLLGGLSWA